MLLFTEHACPELAKVWPNDTIVTVTAKLWYVSDFNGSVPKHIRNTWTEDTPLKRVQAVVKANLDYLNAALANSKIPIRYVAWGSFQDIGKTDAEIAKNKPSNDVFKA